MRWRAVHREEFKKQMIFLPNRVAIRCTFRTSLEKRESFIDIHQIQVIHQHPYDASARESISGCPRDTSVNFLGSAFQCTFQSPAQTVAPNSFRPITRTFCFRNCFTVLAGSVTNTTIACRVYIRNSRFNKHTERAWADISTSTSCCLLSPRHRAEKRSQHTTHTFMVLRDQPRVHGDTR